MVSRASKRPEGGESGEQTIQRPRGLEGTCEGQPRSFRVPDVGMGESVGGWHCLHQREKEGSCFEASVVVRSKVWVCFRRGRRLGGSGRWYDCGLLALLQRHKTSPQGLPDPFIFSRVKSLIATSPAAAQRENNCSVSLVYKKIEIDLKRLG